MYFVGNQNQFRLIQLVHVRGALEEQKRTELDVADAEGKFQTQMAEMLYKKYG